MPQGRSSSRSASLIASSACLLAQYGAAMGWASLPPREPVVTIRPRLSRSSGANAWTIETTPSTLISSWVRH